jgi:diguanylate cyclase (GGDEF)-like protein
MKLLTVGLPEEEAEALAARLPDIKVRAEQTADAALEQLSNCAWTALLVCHDLPDMPALDLVRRLSEQAGGPVLPVVYSANGAHAMGLRKEAERLGVRYLTGKPNAHVLATVIRQVVGSPNSTRAAPVLSAPAQEMAAAVTAIWERFKGVTFGRLETIEAAAVALLERKLDETARRAAEREAHKLAGSVGTFGFADGSRIAREIELLVQGTLGNAETLRLSDLAVALRRALEQAPRPILDVEPNGTAATNGSHGHAVEIDPETAEPETQESLALRPLVLVIEPNLDMSQRLCIEAERRRLRHRVAADADEAQAALRAEAPDAVLLDLCLGGTRESGLALLSEIMRTTPSARVIVTSDSGGFDERLEVARRGGRGFLQKPLSPGRIFDSVTDMLGAVERGTRRVLAVDDDPQVLEALRLQLRDARLDLVTLDNPLRFWEVLETTRPDLLVLDVDMPGLTGLELCTVIRGDPRWAGTPLLFLTGSVDASTIHRLFAAGADDYVPKPFAGPELRMRIENRLDRQQLQRALAEQDPLTGVANRAKALESITHLVHLGARRREFVSVAIVDVDRLRDINREYGSSTGDAVLRRMAKALRDACRQEDVVGRWGGDELVVGFFGASKSEMTRRLRDVLERLRHEVRGDDGRSVAVTCGAGVATFPADGADLPAIVRAAEEILATAKKEGRGMVLPAGWTPDMAEESQRIDVVLVEDDQALSGLLSHTLETRGYSTHCITDGEEAVVALCGATPRFAARVIILDVDLPGRDGFSVLQALAKDGVTSRTRVVMLTVRASEPEVLKALEMGAFDHIGKPFSVQILMQRLRRALGG